MISDISRRRLFGAAALGAAGAALFGGRVASAAPANVASAPANRLPDPGTITATDPAMLSAVEAASLLQSGRLHPRELLDSLYARTRAHDGVLNSWIRVYPELAYVGAEAAAVRLSAARRDGTSAPMLCGLPIALKDLYAVAGLPLTASSKVLEGNIAAGDSAVWRTLSEAGAVLMGHTHMDEFAWGVLTPQVGNPWDPKRSVGGSSGGNGAALAARFVPLAVGTDSGGSLRLPAAACGVSSIKPTYGRIPLDGVIPLIWTMDTAGPMARSLADASLLLTSMSGGAGSVPNGLDGSYPLVARGGDRPLSGRVIGVSKHARTNAAPEVLRLFEEFLALARDLGAELRDVAMPALPNVGSGILAQMGAYHRQFANRLGDYQPNLQPSVAQAVASLAVPVGDFLTGFQDMKRYQDDYNRMFADSHLDAIVYPSIKVDGLSREAFAEGEIDPRWANYAGVPTISIPVGRSKTTGMPVGVELGGLAWGDADLIQLGLELENAHPVWRDVPVLADSPRSLPEVRRGPPGPGPDPTNTQGAAAPIAHAL
ncbi:amidase [Aldersonia sp. NBC_00410]|uniref:amidase n=1 Tax=Aldersonia sp. NBC_00410 TaxID=2975954 RepID=UPI0022524A22|nr:amidase [Aldersonia sp. NBC_00410]MCX5044000.1 amidase [Aldersonia sp. NBC_00410]